MTHTFQSQKEKKKVQYCETNVQLQLLAFQSNYRLKVMLKKKENRVKTVS